MPLVPMVVKQDPRGERSFDIYSRLLDQRLSVLAEPFSEQLGVGQGLPDLVGIAVDGDVARNHGVA